MLVFNYLFECSVLLALLYLLYFIFLKSNTFHLLNRWYLLSSLLLCATIPLIELPKTVIQQSFTYSLPVIEINGSAGNTNTSSNFNWFTFLFTAYFGVATCFVLNLSLKYIKLFIETKNLNFQKYQDCKVHISTINSPAFSFFKYIFIPDLKDEQEREVLLQHELAHAKALHSFDILLVEFFKCLLWFHPFIYWLRNELTAQHEFAIDRQLTSNNFSVQQYGRFLINQTQMQPAFYSVTNFFNKSLIKNRIKMMTTKQSKKRTALNYLTALTMMVGVCIFMIACQHEVPLSSISNYKTFITQNVDDFEVATTNYLPNKNAEQDTAKQKNSSQLEKVPDTKIKNETESAKDLNVKTKPNNSLIAQKENRPKNIQQKRKDDDEIHEIVEVMPQFPGGDEALLEFLYGNIIYPEEAKNDSIQGLAIVSFVVEKDGSITDFKILRSIGGGTDPEVVRVMNLMPKWTPGKHYGEAVRVSYKLPIRFKLN